jgi:hypothetical protein
MWGNESPSAEGRLVRQELADVLARIAEHPIWEAFITPAHQRPAVAVLTPVARQEQ